MVSNSASTSCASCHNPLVIQVEDDDYDDEQDVKMEGGSSAAAERTREVPDDVHLRACGCHFHWQCLLDTYSVNSCPNCATPIIADTHSGQQKIMVDMTNEGGVQENIDILPLLAEDQYLRAYPEERRARAFLELCRAGDLQAIVELLHDEGDDDDEENDDDDEEHNISPNGGSQAQPSHPTSTTQSTGDILRYQDPLGEMQSGLHAAIENKSREVAWLLLLLASTLDLSSFPAAVFQEAASLQIMRDDAECAAKPDIRTLRDAQGRTALEYAREIGPPWTDWHELLAC